MDNDERPDDESGAGAENDGPDSPNQKQNDANRRNALRSTGPQTEGGKARSARNAVRHGVYAGPIAIEQGVFAEDPEEIRAMCDALVDAFTPTNALTRATARQAATAILRSVRFDRYAASELERHGMVDGHDQRMSFDATLEHVAAGRLFRDGGLERVSVLGGRVSRDLQLALETHKAARRLTGEEEA